MMLSPVTMFTVIYRTGGTENCTWKRCLPVETKEEACRQAFSVQRMGYRAVVHETCTLDAIGMPEGWEG